MSMENLYGKNNYRFSLGEQKIKVAAMKRHADTIDVCKVLTNSETLRWSARFALEIIARDLEVDKK